LQASAAQLAQFVTRVGWPVPVADRWPPKATPIGRLTRRFASESIGRRAKGASPCYRCILTRQRQTHVASSADLLYEIPREIASSASRRIQVGQRPRRWYYRRPRRPADARSGLANRLLLGLSSSNGTVHSIASDEDRVVITGIGVITSIGRGREALWQALQTGVSGVRRLTGVPGIPDGMLLGASVDIDGDFPGQLKNIPLSRAAAQEAIADSKIDFAAVNRDRFGCSIGAHMGDTDWVTERVGRSDLIPAGKRPWCEQWFPNTTCSMVANDYGLGGPRLSNSTACASGTIAILKAVRSIRDDKCDVALAGSSEAIHPLFAAGFHNMRVLADHPDPTKACRPFDAGRSGFVMGEGAAMLVLERLSHAARRRAPIYAEILGGRMLSDGYHVTSLDADSDTLVNLISSTLRTSRLIPQDIGYINAHGTGTQQNDVTETRGIRRALGRAANSLCVSANKAALGHLVNASGSVELAITALALRDGFAPPTLNLTDPDPECDLDCIPLIGRVRPLEHALKLSIAFGGHLAAVALRRWTGAGARDALPLCEPFRRAA
jgi:3-oxoacyl-[acyl-carrier-protein] synthase II